jgi:hypothetical protein
MLKTLPKREQTDEQVLERASVLMKGENPPRTLRQLATALKTSDARLQRISKDKLTLNFEQKHTQRLGAEIDNSNEAMCLVQPDENPSMNSLQQKVAPQIKNQHPRPVKTLCAYARILALRNNKVIYYKDLVCEVCGKNNFYPFNASQVLQGNHIFGFEHKKHQHLRVVCANCHSQTLSHGVISDSKTETELHTKPIIAFEVDKINLINPPLSHENPYHRSLLQCLEKQRVKTGETLVRELEKLKQINRATKSNLIRDRLISTGQREAKCECCGILEWRKIKIGGSLKIHHQDGNNLNNNLSNLLLLCPNCHMGHEFAEPENPQKVIGVPTC